MYLIENSKKGMYRENGVQSGVWKDVTILFPDETR